MTVPGTPGDFLAGMQRERLLAIIRATDPDAAIAASLALFASGIRFLEVSLVTTDALGIIAELARLAPSDCLVGAGTVLTTDDVHRSAAAGATFMVTPAITDAIAESARLGLPVCAGALTPTEVVAARRAGATVVKLFPGSFGGPAYLKALRDPLPDVPFVPVGGVDAVRAAEYFAAGALAVGIGSPLLGDAARGGDLDALRARAVSFLAVRDKFNQDDVDEMTAARA
ncbi:MAG: bifunctional 4-hydroxy-2-oxoglutarate aldolase/2-dehydro-3-deoxy-phosphogluconate aldolase [Cryobacterium sp.]|uniref:bifunctional 4-hydroxy-2-oxoglutarate aldolase/2-dehydro-3-deoxy-phosphogluconate aldolase n=1 Tax=unclassified Cryobacterium TaxID=2649013 RepID=UPI001A2FD447|nr:MULTISPECIES: bifunctional 4-hydroxy-2-oxoglutarate aldolase/2-dehydro-3-deoxy-phosphogluconate aldolase [unclassified Cryobacterium]MCY7405248.1 bifunctional 4-hydroxy-2-oxoglutarate aldolase/2-dehydro-3-deoxy-phosphogluconate aldolase [Cryobacterium sp.]